MIQNIRKQIQQGKKKRKYIKWKKRKKGLFRVFLLYDVHFIKRNC